MKDIRSFKWLIFLPVVYAFLYLHPCAFAEEGPGETSASADVTEKAPAIEELADAAEAKARAVEAEVKVNALNKEKQIREEELRLELEKARIKAQEAEQAKAEAKIIKETTEDGDAVRNALEFARSKEEEARISREKAEIHQRKIKTLEEWARMAERELSLARERADIAEASLKARHRPFIRRLMKTAGIILFSYLFLVFIIAFINRRIGNVKTRHMARKNLIYMVNVIVVLAVMVVWIHNIQSITIILSAMGAGIALALHESILCMAGWLYLILRRPYEVGDRIEFGGVKGDVIDIQLFHTTLMELGNWISADQGTGRMVRVPNSMIFKGETFNYNSGFEYIWNEVKILITFESDWKKARDIMKENGLIEAEGMEEQVRARMNSMADHYMICEEKLMPEVFVDVKDSGIELSLRYLTETKRRRETNDDLCRRILEDFGKEPDINFAYPTYRIVKN